MTDNERLTEALRQRADRLDADLGSAHPISLDDVRGRARGIRRRRAAVSGLAAAAVLAVAVPVGLSVTDGTVGDVDRGPAATATADPTGTPSVDPTGSPLPDPTRKVLLTNRVDATSGAPGISYLRDGTLVPPDGREIPVAAGYDSVSASLGGWWVALDIGAGRVDVLNPEGDVTWSGRGTWPLAVSADGSVVAFGTEDGTIMTVEDGGEPQVFAEAGEGPVRVAGIVGSSPCVQSDGDGCTVFYDVDGERLSGGLYMGSQGVGNELRIVRSVESVSPDGLVAGFTEISDDGSCSAVVDDAGTRQWSTCDHSLGRFSPDGRYVIGHPAYRDGIGDGSVAILDAATGAVLVEYQNDIETQAFVNDVAWDSDGTLLATVFERGSWSVMRMSADGQLTEVLGEIGTDEMQVPVRFAARP